MGRWWWIAVLLVTLGVSQGWAQQVVGRCTCAVNADCGGGGLCTTGYCAAGDVPRVACIVDAQCAAGKSCARGCDPLKNPTMTLGYPLKRPTPGGCNIVPAYNEALDAIAWNACFPGVRCGLSGLDLSADTNSTPLPLSKLEDGATAGQCLVAGGGAGNPNFQACPGGGAPLNPTFLTDSCNVLLTGERVLASGGNSGLQIDRSAGTCGAGQPCTDGAGCAYTRIKIPGLPTTDGYTLTADSTTATGVDWKPGSTGAGFTRVTTPANAVVLQTLTDRLCVGATSCTAKVGIEDVSPALNFVGTEANAKPFVLREDAGGLEAKWSLQTYPDFRVHYNTFFPQLVFRGINNQFLTAYQGACTAGFGKTCVGYQAAIGGAPSFGLYNIDNDTWPALTYKYGGCVPWDPASPGCSPFWATGNNDYRSPYQPMMYISSALLGGAPPGPMLTIRKGFASITTPMAPPEVALTTNTSCRLRTGNYKIKFAYEDTTGGDKGITAASPATANLDLTSGHCSATGTVCTGVQYQGATQCTGQVNGTGAGGNCANDAECSGAGRFCCVGDWFNFNFCGPTSGKCSELCNAEKRFDVSIKGSCSNDPRVACTTNANCTTTRHCSNDIGVTCTLDTDCPSTSPRQCLPTTDGFGNPGVCVNPLDADLGNIRVYLEANAGGVFLRQFLVAAPGSCPGNICGPFQLCMGSESPAGSVPENDVPVTENTTTFESVALYIPSGICVAGVKKDRTCSVDGECPSSTCSLDGPESHPSLVTRVTAANVPQYSMRSVANGRVAQFDGVGQYNFFLADTDVQPAFKVQNVTTVGSPHPGVLFGGGASAVPDLRMRWVAPSNELVLDNNDLTQVDNATPGPINLRLGSFASKATNNIGMFGYNGTSTVLGVLGFNGVRFDFNKPWQINTAGLTDQPVLRAGPDGFGNGSLEFGIGGSTPPGGRFRYADPGVFALDRNGGTGALTLDVGPSNTTSVSQIRIFGSPNGITTDKVALYFNGATLQVDRPLEVAGNLLTTGVALASLGTPAAGATRYCTDCTLGSRPCTGGGTGAWAFREGTTPVWNCGGGGGWTDAGTVVHLNTLTDKVAIGTNSILNGALSLKPATTPANLLTFFENAPTAVHYGIGLRGDATAFSFGQGEIIYHTSGSGGFQRFGYGDVTTFTQVMGIKSAGQVVIDPASAGFNGRLSFGNPGTDQNVIALHETAAGAHYGIGLGGTFGFGGGHIRYYTGGSTGAHAFGHGSAASFNQVALIKTSGQVVIDPTSVGFNGRLSLGDPTFTQTVSQARVIALRETGSGLHYGIGLGPASVFGAGGGQIRYYTAASAGSHAFGNLDETGNKVCNDGTNENGACTNNNTTDCPSAATCNSVDGCCVPAFVPALTVHGKYAEMPTCAFADLGSLTERSVCYCTDCTATSPCTGSGEGVFAYRVGAAGGTSVWNCAGGASLAGTSTLQMLFNNANVIAGSDNLKFSPTTFTLTMGEALTSTTSRTFFETNPTVTVGGSVGVVGLQFRGTYTQTAGLPSTNTLVGAPTYSINAVNNGAKYTSATTGVCPMLPDTYTDAVTIEQSNGSCETPWDAVSFLSFIKMGTPAAATSGASLFIHDASSLWSEPHVNVLGPSTSFHLRTRRAVRAEDIKLTKAGTCTGGSNPGVACTTCTSGSGRCDPFGSENQTSQTVCADGGVCTPNVTTTIDYNIGYTVENFINGTNRWSLASYGPGVTGMHAGEWHVGSNIADHNGTPPVDPLQLPAGVTTFTGVKVLEHGLKNGLDSGVRAISFPLGMVITQTSASVQFGGVFTLEDWHKHDTDPTVAVTNMGYDIGAWITPTVKNSHLTADVAAGQYEGVRVEPKFEATWTCDSGTRSGLLCTTDDTNATTGCPAATCPNCCDATGLLNIPRAYGFHSGNMQDGVIGISTGINVGKGVTITDYYMGGDVGDFKAMNGTVTRAWGWHVQALNLGTARFPFGATEHTIAGTVPSNEGVWGVESGAPGRFYFRNESGHTWRTGYATMSAHTAGGLGAVAATTTATFRYFSAQGGAVPVQIGQNAEFNAYAVVPAGMSIFAASCALEQCPASGCPGSGVTRTFTLMNDTQTITTTGGADLTFSAATSVTCTVASNARSCTWIVDGGSIPSPVSINPGTSIDWQASTAGGTPLNEKASCVLYYTVGGF